MNDLAVQNIELEGRKNLKISGVNKIESLNPNEFQIETALGSLKILGENMEMKSFDIDKGNMLIVGSIDSLAYYTLKDNKKNKGFIQKLFK